MKIYQRVEVWIAMTVSLIAAVLMAAVTSAAPDAPSNYLVQTPIPTPIYTCGWWCPKPKQGPGTCLGCEVVESAFLDRLLQSSVPASRGADLQIPVGDAELDQVVVVRIDRLTNLPHIVGSASPNDIINGANFDLGIIADDTPSGLYLVAGCSGDCSSMTATEQLDSILAGIDQGASLLTSFVIESKIADLEISLQKGSVGASRFLDVRWNNTSPATSDDITLAWSKDGKPIAALSNANPLQRVFGYLDASGDGTRLYNTPLINIAPLAPVLVPGLAADLPSGEYQVDLYVNGALEGVQTIHVGTP